MLFDNNNFLVTSFYILIRLSLYHLVSSRFIGTLHRSELYST